MTVSAVIPTYNRADMVCRCIKSILAAEKDGFDVEIIVVDDASPDGTRDRIASEFRDSPLTYLRNGKNSFQAVSRNRGAAAAKGEYILFLDDDNEVDPRIFKELLEVFKSHPRAGLVAPMAIHKRPSDENLVWSLGSGFNRWTSMPQDRMPNLPLAELPAGQDVYPTTYYPNGFMVSRAAFDATGGFDEKYIQIFEESDFGWKIMEAGYEEYVSTKARTWHYGFLEPGCAPELRRLGIERPLRTYCFAKNRLRFARKHFNFLQVLSVSLVFAPLSAVYYSAVALKHRRADIAWAYIKGTLAGIFGL